MEKASLFLNFLHLAENLKNELRNGKTSKGKPESVAEHCWRLALMVILFGGSLDSKVCIEKALKLAIVHDIAEAITGDQPYFVHEKDEEARQAKLREELKAMEQIRSLLPQDVGAELFALWQEYEEGETIESKFVKALDKIEAQIQQNEMDFVHWAQCHIQDSISRLDKYCHFDSFLQQFKSLVQQESQQKISKKSSGELEIA